MIFPRGGGPPTRVSGALRWGVCLATALLALAVLPSVAAAAVSNAAANNSRMLQFMNSERAARGLAPLARDPRLDALAQSWADKMAEARTMYHPSPPQAMSAGYRSGAQNLAWHDTTLSASWAHNFWMNSAPHRKNILDPAFTHTGIAMACNPSGGRYPYVFATVEFGGNSTPLSSVPPASPQVAGGGSGTGAGCDGEATADPAPPPPAPAPPPPPAAAASTAAAPRAAATAADPASRDASSPASSPRPSGSAKPPPTGSAASPEPSASPAALAAGPGESPAPGRSAPPPGGREPQELGPLAAAGSDRAEPGSGAVAALVAGLSGIVLMSRISSRRNRRVAPKHAINRR